MKYLLDTNMVTALMKENENFLGHLQNLPDTDTVMTTIFTYGEIYYGINILSSGKRRNELEQKARYAFSDLPILPADERVATCYIQIKSDLKKKGRPFHGENDLWIAATAPCSATSTAFVRSPFFR